MQQNDVLIWENFKKGDKSAFSHIYHQNVKLLYNFGIKYTNDHELVKDCIQELFLYLVRSKDSLGTIKNIRHYLMVSVKRSIIKELVKRKNITEFDSEKQKLPFDIEYSLEESLMNNEIKDEKNKELLKALKKLSPRQKEVIYLRFNCSMEYEEICEVMDVTYDAARKLVYRAIKVLKKAYRVNVR